MPIHDQSYRRYKGDRAPQGRAWTVIATAGIRQMLAKKKFLALLVLAWLPFVVRSVQMYLAANFSQLSVIAPSAATFRQFLDFQEAFVFFITIFTGAGLIANDMRANALQIYLAKPMSRFEYIAGKFAVLAFFLLLVTWLPATMLLVIQIVFAGNLQFISANLYLIPAILVATGIETVVLSMVMLALSSLSKSARFVGIMYAGALFFTQGLYGVVFVVTRRHAVHLDLAGRHPAAPGRRRSSACRRATTRPAGVSVLALAVVVGLAAFVLERRVRGVEVVT